MSRRDHLGRITPGSTEAVRVALEILENDVHEYALVGGWAVYAYGSRIPSIDTDVFLSREGADRFRRALAQGGLEALEGPDRHIEILSADEPNELHGYDWELEAIPAYMPAALLKDRMTRVALELGDARLEAAVPDATALAFMKLKAFHDRCFDYRAVTDARYMARINPSDRPLIAQRLPGHYLREAGKDLFDVAFLSTTLTSLHDALGVVPNLTTIISAALLHVPGRIQQYALELAEEHGPVPQWIRDHTTVAEP